jgi:hypothetical protein
MFFPDGEMPTAALEVALTRLGVACRRLGTGAATLTGFTLKAAAVLLSSFEEVNMLSGNRPALHCTRSRIDHGHPQRHSY